jgi:uncharacterized protein YjbJ (UPF0337 family)
MKTKSMTDDGVENSVRGKGNIVAGRVQDAVGALTGDAGLQIKGKLKTGTGKVQDAVGKAERKLDRKP